MLDDDVDDEAYGNIEEAFISLPATGKHMIFDGRSASFYLNSSLNSFT